jgi:hypothetical protein
LSKVTIRLPEAQHERLELPAKSIGRGVNKVVEDITTPALALFDRPDAE